MEKYNLSELERNFSFNEKDIVSTHGVFSDIYKTVEPGKVTKIMKQKFSEDPSINNLLDKDWYTMQGNEKKSKRKMEKLENEVFMGKKAKEFGINVPEVDGVYLVKNNDSGKFFPGVVVDYLDGKMVNEIVGNKINNYERIRDLWLKETEKASQFFEEHDFTNNSNAIYVPKEDKVYLFDFADWKLKV